MFYARISLIFLCFIFFNANASFSQTNEEKAVQTVIDNFFEAMRQGDAIKAKEFFVPGAILTTTHQDMDKKPLRQSSTVKEFLKTIEQHDKGELDEKLWSYHIQVNQDLASVWTDYTFYYKGALSHCGVNSFALHQTDTGWKIINIVDTRAYKNCQTEATDISKEVDELMNAWHHAAATADEDVFFGSMTSGGIYIGTDKTELWTNEEMAVWAKKYFERETAWDFKTIDRNVYATQDGQTAWFDELLDTWMGVCRSSGVVVKENGEWKIAHYHLSVTVDNDDIQDFIKLTTKEDKK